MRLRPVLTFSMIALGLIAVAGSAGAAEPTIDPDTAVSSDATSAASTTLPDDLGATPIEPDPTVTDPHPQAWDQITVASDGRTLSIYFWMGVEECNGLHSVSVDRIEGGIDVRLRTGTPAGAGRTACIAIAQQYVTTATLDQPLIANVE